MNVVMQILVVGAIITILDYLWLGKIAKKIYHKEMGGLLRNRPNITAALAFYIIYTIGVVALVVNPALNNNSLAHAVVYGALFGFTAYATYNLTNLSVIKGFTTKIVIIDLIWGTFLTATASALAFLIVNAWLH